jgi:hypothetical protein
MAVTMKAKICLVLLLLFGLVFEAASPRISQAATNQAIYTDALASGWEDWSWDATINLSSTTPVQAGSHAISAQITAAWGALYLHSDPAVDLAGYDRLRFWIHGGSAGGQHLRVVANGEGTGYAVTPQAGQWTQVVITLSALGSPTNLTDLYWQDNSGAVQPIFSIDQIELLASSGTATPTPLPGNGPALTVNVAAGIKPISQTIYGMNFADESLAAELDLPVDRRGGNSTTRYNWRVDAYNTGSDWYFENIAEDNPAPGELPNGSAADRFVEQDRGTGTETILTIPMIGWVAKSRVTDHPYDCGFKVSKYGAQQNVDTWDTNCGNGVNAAGVNITGNDPTDTSLAVGPQFVKDWVTHLVGRYGLAASGGVRFYNLDNEPMLWNSTHRDVHPAGVTYNELRDRTYLYAAAIKQADPGAQTLGPVLWGWCAYLYSAADGCSAGSDYASHGNTYFVPWYLQQMQAYQTANGTRILDYLDLHYYPQADGVSLADTAGSAATQALRLRSTRSLWDATYKDESWISDTAPGGVAVNLIGRMKAWVSASYPGTKLAITEYNWGALGYINGALAQADVLGIFGREGLDLATLWGPPNANQPGAFAFRMYRNYDGQGHKFGETSIQASSADQAKLAVYAAKRNDQALTIMVINKTGGALTSSLSLHGFDPLSTAQVYRYSSANLNAIVAQPGQVVGPGGFVATYPANSITLVVIQPGAPLDEHQYLPSVRK